MSSSKPRFRETRGEVDKNCRRTRKIEQAWAYLLRAGTDTWPRKAQRAAERSKTRTTREERVCEREGERRTKGREAEIAQPIYAYMYTCTAGRQIAESAGDVKAMVEAEAEEKYLLVEEKARTLPWSI